MPHNDKEQGGQSLQYEHGIPILNGEARLSEVERKAAAAEAHDQEYKDRQVRINSRLMVFTGLLVFTSFVSGGIAIWQATIANRSAKAAQDAAKAAKDAADVTRQQLVGTQGAVVELSPVWDATKQVLSVILVNANQGGVSAVVSNFGAKLQRKTWPKEQFIGEPFLIELPTPEVTILKGGQFPLEKGLPWTLPPQMKELRMWPGNEVVTLEGSFIYNDGFGNLHSYKFCYLWVAPWTMPPPGNWNGGQWRGGKQGCPTVQEEVNEFLGYKENLKKSRVLNCASPLTGRAAGVKG